MQGNMHYPISTHIVMPNYLSASVLSMLGAKASSWDLEPLEFDVDSQKFSSFPSISSSRYDGSHVSYESRSGGLAHDLFEAMRCEEINLRREKVDLVTESPTSIEVSNSRGEVSQYDYLFVTPAIQTKYEINGKIFNAEYESHINRSVVYEYHSEGPFESAFYHLKGNTPLREVQMFEHFNGNGVIIVKLSRLGSFEDSEWIRETLENVLRMALKRSDLTVVREITYRNTRMNLHSQDHLNFHASRIALPALVPVDKAKTSDEDRYRYSQDISLVLNDINFYKSIAFQ